MFAIVQMTLIELSCVLRVENIRIYARSKCYELGHVDWGQPGSCQTDQSWSMVNCVVVFIFFYCLCLQRCFAATSTVVTCTHKLMTSSVRVLPTATDLRRLSAKMAAALFNRGQFRRYSFTYLFT